MNFPTTSPSPSMSIRYVRHESCLEAVLEGFASLHGAQAALQELGKTSLEMGSDRILINCLGILGQTAPYDHAMLGATLARELPGRRCALLTYASRIKGVLGAAAQEGGVDYRAFSSRAEAVAWLGK